jgi:hypothetical protein
MSSMRERTAPRSPLTRTIRTVLIVALIVVLLVRLLPYSLAPFYRVVNPVSTLMLWRWGRGAPVERATWMPLDRIAPALPRSVIAAEDDRFCSHHGVDFGELREVVRAEVHGVRRPRGGSGLTQHPIGVFAPSLTPSRWSRLSTMARHHAGSAANWSICRELFKIAAGFEVSRAGRRVGSLDCPIREEQGVRLGRGKPGVHRITSEGPPVCVGFCDREDQFPITIQGPKTVLPASKRVRARPTCRSPTL